MSRILRRPMFRGGKVDSYGTGIASGLGTRSGYFRGGGVSYNPFNRAQTQSLVDAYTPRGLPQSFIDFFKANQANQRPSGRFRTMGPGATLQDAEGLLASNTMMTDDSAAGIEDLDTTFTAFDARDEIREEGPKLGVGSDFDKDLNERYLTDSLGGGPERDTGLEALRKGNIKDANKTRIEDLTTEREVEKVDIKDDEPEVTMTDLEKALGLDKARQEYAADALAAASKAFFEGKGFGAIADAAAVKSKAPDIKRLAAIEEFKADRAEKLFDKKQKALKEQKEGTKGAFQKKLETITSQKEGTQGHIIALAEQKLQPTIQGQVASLTSKNFVRPSPAEIKGLMIAYYPQSYEGVVSATEEMAGKKAGTYITEDATTIIFWDGENATTQSI